MKAIATKLTATREKVLVSLLNGEALEAGALDCFKCGSDAMTEFCTRVRACYPGFQSALMVGGLGKHHDGVLVLEGGAQVRYELKHCDKKVAPEALEWSPWEGGVQFAQSQFKAKKAAAFLDGVGMYRAWFDERVVAFLARHPELAVGAVSFADYYKQSSSMTGHNGMTPAAKLLQALRGSGALQRELQDEWLRFEESWMPANGLNAVAFEAYVRAIIEEKDVWFNISQSGAAFIEGFRVLSVAFKEVAKKRDGGCVYVYTMRLAKKSNEAVFQDVPIQFKFTWKNGGQAIQNLNFLLVSA
jgi:hypothetical protein